MHIAEKIIILAIAAVLVLIIYDESKKDWDSDVKEAEPEQVIIQPSNQHKLSTPNGLKYVLPIRS